MDITPFNDFYSKYQVRSRRNEINENAQVIFLSNWYTGREMVRLFDMNS